MIKMNSISGVLLLVSDLDATAEFYEKLGFRPGDRTVDSFKVYINWFWIEFVAVDKNKDTGNDTQFVYITVNDVDEMYEDLNRRGFNPSDPQTYPSKRRETMISDPDGYKLVFFNKK